MREIIQRAIDNGWKVGSKNPYSVVGDVMTIEKQGLIRYSLNDLLADEGFCKAIFGKEGVCFKCGKPRESFKHVCDYCCWTIDSKLGARSLAYIFHCKALSTIFNQADKIRYIKETMNDKSKS
jgi:hypothetical protein